MRNIILIIAVFTTTIASFNSKAQVIKQGDVLIDTYYGFPNLYILFFKKVIEINNIAGLTTFGLGPLTVYSVVFFAQNGYKSFSVVLHL